MACACGSKIKPKATYLASFSDGTKKVYSSEIEARSAVKRKGGSWKKQ